jgi:hypothetical protein
MSIEDIRRIKSQAGIPKPKKQYSIPKVSKKRISQNKLLANNDDAQDLWFEQKRKEMKGRCVFCGGKTEKDNDEMYKFSIAHLLAKRPTMFPSVATHPDNFLELCFFGESCHTNFDNGIITWELLKDSQEWDIIVTKFKNVYPYIAENEKRNIPPLLLKELEK